MYEPSDMDRKAFLDEREQTAKNNLKAWVEWFRSNYPSRVPTKTALAKELDLSGGAVTQFLDPRKPLRGVSMRTLIAVKFLLGSSYTIDALLFTPPPETLPTETKGGHAVKGHGKR